MYNELLRMSATMCTSYLKKGQMHLVRDAFMDILDNLVAAGVINADERHKLMEVHASNYNQALDGSFKDSVMLSHTTLGDKTYISVLNMDAQKIIDALKLGTRTIGYIKLDSE